MEANKSIAENLSRLKTEVHNIKTFIERLLSNNVIDAEQRDSLLAISDEAELVDNVFHILYTTNTEVTPLIATSLKESANETLGLLLEAHSHSESLILDNQQIDLEYYDDKLKAFFKKKPEVDEVDSHPMSPSGMVRLATQRLDLNPPRPLKAYKMGSRPKGYALIINIEDFPNDPKKFRHGSNQDFINLQDLFQQLGYIIEPHQNPTAAEMQKIIEVFAKDEKHLTVDSCVVFIMSHGASEKNDKFVNIQASDLNFVNSLDIIKYFIYPTSKVFGTEKPIIFFFQACRYDDNENVPPESVLSCCMLESKGGTPIERGDLKDYGRPKSGDHTPRQSRRAVTDGSVMKKANQSPEATKGRKYDHMLIVNACIPGHVSLRDQMTGAWFVECICKIFQQHAWEYDIDTMLSMVDDEIRKIMCDIHGMQTTTIEKWGFTKKFYFNPGLYDDDVDVSLNGINLSFDSQAANDTDLKAPDVGDGVSAVGRRLHDVAISVPPEILSPSSSCEDVTQSTLL